MLAVTRPIELLDTALNALRTEGDWRSVLDRFEVPTYTTDAHGAVTYWNRACVDFAGREPELGKDRWCVTWQLYATTGERMPHEDCPMAETIRTRKEVRGKVAIAMRPDGTRRAFTPYPAPIFDESGEFSGAVNLLVDISDEQARGLREQASRCRRLARSTNDQQASDILRRMAVVYADTAESLDH
jgi:PAS domain S-box-containing protein